MKTNIRQILIFSLIIILLCFIVVLILTLPAFIKQFNFTTDAKSNIGSTIGGLTAPIIGIVSSVLLYLALTRQTESNVDQRLRNESDMIFLLLNQLDSEISSFYYNYTQRKGDQKTEFNFNGIQAFHEFVRSLSTQSGLSSVVFTFHSFYQAKQILLFIRSYSLIEKRIGFSELSDDLKEMFLQKLNSVYECKFKRSLDILCDVFEKNPNIKDFATEEVITFHKAHTEYNAEK